MTQQPQNLRELIAQENHEGFRLALAHYAELAHGLMGTFPAIESESGEIIMTTDLDLLKEVCAMLPQRRFKFGAQLIYVNTKAGVAYSVLGTHAQALEKAEPFTVFTRERFNQLCKKKRPFKWAPGLVGDDMSTDEFRETLEAALASAKAD